MNVAELVGSRAGELAAFSTLLFRSHRRGSDNNNNSNNNSNGLGNVRLVKSHAEDYNFPRRLTVSQYRRPSSPNVPFRSVRRYALKRARRGTPVMNVKRKTPRKRLLTYAQWCLLLKRGRRFALRRRRTACSRTKRRAWALRHGKHQQPLCACAMPAPDAVARPLFTAGKRISVVWLPSHWLLRRRFHYTVAKISVQTCPRQYYSDNATITGSGCSSPPVASVRIAVPARSQRKQHRVLQRWVARLPSPAALPVGMRSPRRRTSKVTAVPPPACLLADRSHVCVWFIRPRSAEKRFSAEELMDLLIMRTANTPSEQCYTKAFSPGKASLHSPGDMWKPNCCDAYYGYMWCAAEGGGCSSLKGYNKLVSSSPTTVGVVTPVIMLCVCGKDGESVGNCYLISSSVVP
uniref:Uncharacterized protein n=1 Tax=Trypanosoma congolense (strain IL3000) TaxID=1068625 RepID=G0UXN9_TRYCI|nr:conserved hypothetical protein [Trypanosoma congolense IL3000]